MEKLYELDERKWPVNHAGLPCQRHENFNSSFLSFVYYKDLAQLCITRKLFHASSLLRVLT